MRNYSFLFLAAVVSGLSLGAVKAVSAEEVIVVKEHRPHYVARDGYYWDGPHAYRRVWVAREHRYDYRPVKVVKRREVIVVHDRP